MSGFFDYIVKGCVVSRPEFEKFRVDDLRHFLALVIKFLSIPVMCIGIVTDVIQFGFRAENFLFRCSWVVIALVTLFYLKKPRKEISLFLLSLVLLSANNFLLVDRIVEFGGIRSDFKMVYWQGLLCFVLIPLRPLHMAVGIFSTVSLVQMAVWRSLSWDSRFFGTHFFIDTIISTFLFFLAYLGIKIFSPFIF